MTREEAEQVVALLPSVGSRSDGGGDRPWWVVDGKSVATDGDGDWFVEVRWSQSGFRRGDRQRDLVSFVTGDRVIGVQQMAWDIREFTIQEPHGFGGTPAADGRVWWDSRDGGEPADKSSQGRTPGGPGNHGEDERGDEGRGDVVAVFIGPVVR